MLKRNVGPSKRISKYPAQPIRKSEIRWRKEKARAPGPAAPASICDEVPTSPILNAVYAYLIHFMISGSVGFLPYMRMPMR